MSKWCCEKHMDVFGPPYFVRFHPNACPYCENDRLKAELEQVKQTNENIAGIVDGYELCCCGNSIADHGYIDGHGPVSMLDHHVDCRVKERTAQLEQQLTTAKAALEQEESHTTELCKELAEAREELASYKAGVEVEGEVYAVAPNGQDVVGKVGIHVPENYIGQRVRVLVRAIEPIAMPKEEGGMIYDNEMKDRVEQLKSQLRTLAQAVLEAHGKPYCNPYTGRTVDTKTCDCEACTLAREVLK